MQFDLNIARPAIPEQRVIFAVVIMAVMDACVRPLSKSLPDPLAMDAHDFIWGGRLELFLHYTDLEPEWFRRALTESMESRSAVFERHFSPEQRRAFRANRRLHARLKTDYPPLPADYDNEANKW
jgi:hypothetical protein